MRRPKSAAGVLTKMARRLRVHVYHVWRAEQALPWRDERARAAHWYAPWPHLTVSTRGLSENVHCSVNCADDWTRGIDVAVRGVNRARIARRPARLCGVRHPCRLRGVGRVEAACRALGEGGGGRQVIVHRWNALHALTTIHLWSRVDAGFGSSRESPATDAGVESSAATDRNDDRRWGDILLGLNPPSIWRARHAASRCWR